ncbi:HAD-IIIC family phosphatase [Granulicella tundricola]|nr:HAD-IIIC family phosphatase [Granulicella tundricola]
MIDLDFCSADELLLRRRSLRRELSAVDGLQELRIAVLGGSTTDQIVTTLEIFLLAAGFQPVFHQSEYGRYYDDAVYDPQTLIDFRPNLVYIHTSCRNVRNLPPLNCTESQLPGYVETELNRFKEIWDSLDARVGCQVIQNNFEMPPHAILGNMDAVAAGGENRFLMELNVAFAREATRRPRLLLQDVHGISAKVGLRNWFDWTLFFNFKLLLQPAANLELARSLNAMIQAIYGKSRKVLVLDLDNTLWGGTIGDDGVDKILIGRETPQAEAYTAFQEYCLSLRNRGILLAICSKNDEDIAKAGFSHPDSILKLEHISCFKANWEPKHENIALIAKELNLGVDSFVFVDDNPAERAIVQAQIPGVAVPDIGNDVTHYAEVIQAARYFEPASLSREDRERAALYASNLQRADQAATFNNYGEYLDSLDMSAEIDSFKPVYLERIAQLTNKTNQFNLTSRRYTLAEMEVAMRDRNTIALYGKLSDRFGDNGLISIVLGRRDGDTVHIDLWLMSCRVLKRSMETAMLDALAERALGMGVKVVRGNYLPTAKNSMVADHYSRLGFQPCPQPSLPEGATAWQLNLTGYVRKNSHIRVLEYTHV